MSFDPPAGILDIGNATLRVGKLEVAETTGLSQGLQNIIKNDLLVTENETYTTDQKWGLKLPNTWVSEFELKGGSGKYVEFNFYNEGSTSNTLGYTLNFKDTTLSLRYDNGSWTTATIPTIVDTYRKVNVFFERNVISVTIDGTQVLYYKHTGTPPPVMSRVTSATGGAFVNAFFESNHSGNSEFKNLRIVNGRFISDQTSNIAFMGGNLGVGVNSPQEALDIRGNMHLNRVSNVSSVSVDSNVVTEYTGPHDRPLGKYPEVAMTADDNLSTLGYKASVSSQLTGNDAFRAFDATGATTYWHSQYPYYTHVTGTYNPGQSSGGTGTPSGTLPTTELISGHQGEWIKLQMPKKIKLEEVRVYASNRAAAGTNVYQMPKDIAIAGSNDGTNWYLVDSGTLPTRIRESYGMASLPVTTSSYYSYLALIVKTTDNQGANYSAVEIGNIEYYGREEGDASLDTTLKTVYNVPATTGTQLEVYYDAKGESTVQSPIPDLSPNTNTGAVSGHSPTLDSTGGIDSFKFNGSSQYVTGAHGLTTGGGPVHTISLWLNAVETTNYTYAVQLGQGGTSHQQSAIMFYDNKISHAHWGSGVLSDITIAKNEWYHVVAVFTGGNGSDLSKHKIFINGEDGRVGPFPGSTDGAVVLTGTQLTLGRKEHAGGTPGDYFNGSIANFRLYSKALNAEQVQELYDYQKDYFLRSKSQVTLYKGRLGVGVTEPSGQLELAGDERIQEYPPRGMRRPSDAAGQAHGTYIEGHGMFKATSSGVYTGSTSNYQSWMAFNKVNASPWNGNTWNGMDNVYSDSTGYYTATQTMLAGYRGDWLKLELPYQIKLYGYTIGVRGAWYKHAPDDWVILGSNDDNNWEVVDSVVSTASGTSLRTSRIPESSGDTVVYRNLTVNSTKYYKYFVLLTTKLRLGPSPANVDNINISDLRYYGTPAPTTLDKGSLSLTRSLDVPRVSRYDVDTETPRPEKLLVDYDTSTHPFNFTSVKDKSGRGNNAFSVAGAIYDTDERAFKFDGTNDGLYAEHPIGNSWGSAGIGFPTGDAIYTMSCWIKKNPSQPTTHPAVFYVGSGWATYKLAGIFLRDANKLAADIGSSAVISANPNINSGQWHHIAIVKRGTGALSTSDSYMGLFVDGVEITAKTQDSNLVQALDAVDFLSIGCDFNGSMNSFGSGFNGHISKPQIWSVALEPSEIMKVYKLGRVGRSMVLADTNLQIGAGHHSSIQSPPYATLDVHGHALISGELQCMEGNFHKMLGFARGGGHADHHRTDNCLVAMAGTTVVSSGHSYVSFAIRKSPNWMPFFVEVYHTGVDHDSSDLFSRVSHFHGRIYGASVDHYNHGDGVSASAGDMGGDMVRFRVFVNREGRHYGVTMVKLSYYYGIRGRMD